MKKFYFIFILVIAGFFRNTIVAQINVTIPITAVSFPKEVIPVGPGKIEFWAKLSGFSGPIPWAVSQAAPQFFEINDGKSQYVLAFHGNDGGGNGGLCGTALQTHVTGTGDYFNTYTYEGLLGAGRVEDWHHYVFKWNNEGIPGVGNGLQPIAIYIDGVLNNYRLDPRPFQNRYMPVQNGTLNLISSTHNPNMNIPPGEVAIDEFKIYDGNDNLILWNTLGSISEIEHSVVGLNGSFNGGGNAHFVTGVSGNAVMARLVFARVDRHPIQPPSTNCPQIINSTSIVASTIDDTTMHTYSTPNGGIGSFSDCQIIRTFSAPVKSVTLIIEAGFANDVGYVGNKLVTQDGTGCFGYGSVAIPVDVSSEATISGNSVTVTLRARETCGSGAGGWGGLGVGIFYAPNPWLHWIVNLEPEPTGRCCIYLPNLPTDCTDHTEIASCIQRFISSGAAASDVLWTRDSTCASSCPNIIPRRLLNLKSFDALYSNDTKSVQLSWEILSEKNNAGFFIERSRDGQKFKRIEFLQPKSNSPVPGKYLFTDVDPFTVGYYRLVQLVDNGTIAHSPIVSAIGGEDGELLLSPNPTSGKLRIALLNMQLYNTEVTVMDISGRVVISQKLTNGQHELNIEHLPSGTFIIRISQNGKTYIRKFIKE